MHHAKEPYEFDEPPSHAFAVARDGALAALLLEEFPDAYFNREFGEWRVDWDEKQYPDQGRRLDAFAARHGLEILHRY